MSVAPAPAPGSDRTQGATTMETATTADGTTTPAPGGERFLEALRRQRATAILRTDRAEAVGPAMDAAVEGGFEVLEVTLTTPGALEHIARLTALDGGRLTIGAGTVLTTEQARAAIDAGAGFLVSPIVDESIIGFGAAHGVAVMPGTMTPTEMVRADRAGATAVKLFPAPGTGPKFVRAVLGPLPSLRIVPTNGVHLNNAASYLRAGAFAVGFTTGLFDPNALDAADWDRVRERAAALLEALRGTAGPDGGRAKDVSDSGESG